MPNRILTEDLKMSPKLIGLSKPARLFFFHLWVTVDDYRRAPLGPSPAEPTVLRSLCHPAEPAIRIPDVARWIGELIHTGAVAVHDSDRGWYIEIAEDLWYRREDYAEKQPKYGPRLKKAPEQQTLPLGPVGLAGKRPPPERDSQCNHVPTQAIRVEYGVADDESAREARKDSGAVRRGDSKDSDKRKGGRFAASSASKGDDPVWEDFCRWVSGGALMSSEMWENGKAHLQRLATNRRAFAEALGEVKLMEDVQNKGAAFVAAYNRIAGEGRVA